jgi:hypothetical protein
MSRTFLTVIALGALLSANACTQTTALDTNSDNRRTAGSGGDKNPSQIESPDEVTPGDGDGGGSTPDIKDPVSSNPGRGQREPVEQTPVEGDNSGSDTMEPIGDPAAGTSGRRTRTGHEGQHTP